MNSLQQQARFDAFMEEFNTERPHQALEMQRPAEVYFSSSRPYVGLPDLEYPLHDREYLVTACGRICMHRKGSISRPFLPVRNSGSRRSTMAFG
jgi:hypothetical protein